MTLPAFDHGLTVHDYKEMGAKLPHWIEALVAAAKAVTDVCRELKDTGFIKEDYWHLSKAMPEISKTLKAGKWKALGATICSVLQLADESLEQRMSLWDKTFTRKFLSRGVRQKRLRGQRISLAETGSHHWYGFSFTLDTKGTGRVRREKVAEAGKSRRRR